MYYKHYIIFTGGLISYDRILIAQPMYANTYLLTNHGVHILQTISVRVVEDFALRAFVVADMQTICKSEMN